MPGYHLSMAPVNRSDSTQSATPRRTVVRHPPLRSQVAQIIREAIVNLEFEPGSVLIERELCEMTQTSRASVREALRQLEAEGLVEARNGRGIMVRAVSADEARDLYEVRAELEGLAGRLFAERASADEVAELHQALKELVSAGRGSGEARAILDAQSRFYAILFQGAGNQFLDETVQGIQWRVAQLRAVTLGVPGRIDASIDEFVQIVDRIDAGDLEGVREATRRHVMAAAEALRQVASS